MTDLLDRIQHRGIDEAFDETAIAVHSFSGAIVLATLQKATRQQVINAYNLVGDEVVQLDQIIAVYQSKGGGGRKDYLDTFVAGLLVYADATITKAQLMTILEI